MEFVRGGGDRSVIDGITKRGAVRQCAEGFTQTAECVRTAEIPVGVSEERTDAAGIAQRGPHCDLIRERLAPGAEADIRIIDVRLERVVHKPRFADHSAVVQFTSRHLPGDRIVDAQTHRAFIITAPGLCSECVNVLDTDTGAILRRMAMGGYGAVPPVLDERAGRVADPKSSSDGRVGR